MAHFWRACSATSLNDRDLNYTVSEFCLQLIHHTTEDRVGYLWNCAHCITDNDKAEKSEQTVKPQHSFLSLPIILFVLSFFRSLQSFQRRWSPSLWREPSVMAAGPDPTGPDPTGPDPTGPKQSWRRTRRSRLPSGPSKPSPPQPVLGGPNCGAPLPWRAWR